MAIGTPATIGTANGSPGASSYALTTSAAILAGDLVLIAFIYDGSASISVSSVTDGSSNTYAKAVASSSGTTINELWYAMNATALGSSGTITVNLSGAATGASPAVQILGTRVTGIVGASAVDQTAHQEATTASPSVTTGTLSIPNELAIGVAYNQNTGATYTESSGFSNINGASVNGISKMSYKIVSATTAVTYAPTWSVSGVARTLIATFKANATAQFNLAMIGM